MDVERDLKRIKEGFEGEKVVRNYLKTISNCTFAQLDMIAVIDDKWYSIEAKHQEMFKSPPFDGHGLPIWQVETRIRLYKDTGIIPLLFVLDKNTKELIYNSLLILENGKKFITGRKSRVIYPIENFKVINK